MIVQYQRKDNEPLSRKRERENGCNAAETDRKSGTFQIRGPFNSLHYRVILTYHVSFYHRVDSSGCWGNCDKFRKMLKNFLEMPDVKFSHIVRSKWMKQEKDEMQELYMLLISHVYEAREQSSSGATITNGQNHVKGWPRRPDIMQLLQEDYERRKRLAW